MDAGRVHNAVTATGNPPADPEKPGEPVPPVTDEDDEDVDPEQKPGIEIVKTADKTSGLKLGDVVTYIIRVKNTGNVTLKDVELEDSLVELDGFQKKLGTMVPGEARVLSYKYTITQADVDAGKVHNVATVTGNPPEDPDKPGEPVPPVEDEDEEDVTPDRHPGIEVIKTADKKEGLKKGDVVTYTVTVTNTGDVTLENVTVDDSLVQLPAEERLISILKPGKTAVIVYTYTITQADVDAGKVHNVATAKGNPPKNPDKPDEPVPPVEDDDDEDVTPEQTPDIRVIKTADKTVGLKAGDVITYTILVRNTGNVTLTDVELEDSLVELTGGQKEIGTLAPGAEKAVTYAYTVTQADVDAGKVHNAVTAKGNPPQNPDKPDEPVPPVEDEDEEDGTPEQKPGIRVIKTADRTAGLKLGDVVNYTILVKNTGKVTLTDVTLEDSLVALSGGQKEIGTLLPGEEKVIGYAYTITQADVDAGRVHNVATVKGNPPENPDRPGEPVPPVEDEDDEDVTPKQKPGLEVVKTADRTKGLTAGDTVTYTVTVTNTGNVMLTGVTLEDSLVELTGGQKDIGTLAPGEQKVITYTYTVTEADVDAGKVHNVAVAKGNPPENPDRPGEPVPPVEDEDEEDVTPRKNPSLEVEKKADKTKGLTAGDVVTWTITVRNNGETVLTDVTLEDSLVELTGGQKNLGTLEVGEEKVITYTSTITQAEVDNGRVHNVVTAKGNPPQNPEKPDEPVTPVEDEDEEDVIPKQDPDLEVIKTADKKTGLKAGDIVTYTVTVRNAGTVTLTEVTLTDTLVELSAEQAAVGTLLPGEEKTVSYPYEITAADVEAGRVDNTAEAKGRDPRGDEVTGRDEEQVLPEQNPEITVIKTADRKEGLKAGDIVNYTVTVRNTGDVTVRDITLEDSLTELTGEQKDIGTLAPGEEKSITYPYEITEADVEAGKVRNVATAVGYGPEDEKVTGEDDETVIPGEEGDPIHTVTVYYWYEQIGGQPAAETVIIPLHEGDPFRIVSPRIPGYTPDLKEITGEMGGENLVYHVIYTGETYTLTVIYVDLEGNEVAPRHRESGLHPGDLYSVESPVIPGYTTKDKVVEGSMPAMDKTVVVIYAPAGKGYTILEDYDTPLAAGNCAINVGECFE